MAAKSSNPEQSAGETAKDQHEMVEAPMKLQELEQEMMRRGRGES